MGEVFQHSPNADYFQDADRWLVTTGAIKSQAIQPEQVVKETNRAHFNEGKLGPAGAVNFNPSEKRPMFKKSTNQQLHADIDSWKQTHEEEMEERWSLLQLTTQKLELSAADYADVAAWMADYADVIAQYEAQNQQLQIVIDKWKQKLEKASSCLGLINSLISNNDVETVFTGRSLNKVKKKLVSIGTKKRERRFL